MNDYSVRLVSCILTAAVTVCLVVILIDSLVTCGTCSLLSCLRDSMDVVRFMLSVKLVFACKRTEFMTARPVIGVDIGWVLVPSLVYILTLQDTV